MYNLQAQQSTKLLWYFCYCDINNIVNIFSLKHFNPGTLGQLITIVKPERFTCSRDQQTESVLWQGGNLAGTTLKAESRITMSVRSAESTVELNAEGNSDSDWTPKGRNKKVKSHTQLHTVRRCCRNLPDMSKKPPCTNNGILGSIFLLKIHINSRVIFFFLTLKISAGKPLSFFSKHLSPKGKRLMLRGFCFQTWHISRATSETSVLFIRGIRFIWLARAVQIVFLIGCCKV